MLTESEICLINSDELLSELFSTVKACQERYGGRTELATDQIACVVALCHSIEKILMHGLRCAQNKSTNAISQVRNLVSSFQTTSPNPSHDKPVLWLFIKELLTHHEYNRFLSLKNVNTDKGRSRSWLRSLLNEHSLERYIAIILSEEELLKIWYEPYGLLRNKEKSSLISTIASGIDTILFAISIDKAALNDDGKVHSRNSNKSVKEQDALLAKVSQEDLSVTPGSAEVKKRKKVPSQFISFDDDAKQDEDNFQYHSAPTTCVNSPSYIDGKCTPYSDVIKKIRSPNQIKIQEIQHSSTDSSSMAENSIEKEDLKSGGLKPLSGSEILYPINQQSESLYGTQDSASLKSSLGDNESINDNESLNELLDKCTGSRRVSSVTSVNVSSLTVEELKSALLEISQAKETAEDQRDNLLTELKVLKEKYSKFETDFLNEQSNHSDALKKINLNIKSVNRENELLRMQLKKYVSAVQMLKRDDADSNVEEIISVNKGPEIRDYHDEAVAYESKLIQVAEMHGELIEFNEKLQKLLRFKENLCSRYRNELIELRGPFPQDEPDHGDNVSLTSDIETASNIPALINIWIPSAFLSGTQGDNHHVYQIYIRIQDTEWNVYRRFAQFYELHRSLRKKYAQVKFFDFPQKKTFGSKDVTVVEDRRVRLQQYLRDIINVFLSTYPQLSANPQKSMLTEKLQFLSDEDFTREQPSRSVKKLFSRKSKYDRPQTSSPPPQYNGL